MDITISELIVWLVVGGIAGSLIGALVKGKKEGYGRWKNFAIGLVGAVIGGVIFNLFKIDLGLGDIKITVEDLISALAGSLLLIIVMWFIGKKKGAKKKAT